MRVISTKMHGFIDYIVGVLLITAPWLFGFYQGGVESWLPIIFGIAIILYSLLTDYELGISRVISMNTHLFIDLIAGIFLASSPWLFGFANYVYLPHLIVGIMAIGFSVLTKTVPSTGRSHGTVGHA